MKQIVSTTQIIIFPGAVLLNAAIALFYRSFQVGQRLTVVFFKGIGPKKSSLPPLHVSSAENPQRLLHPCVTDISCAIMRCNVFKMSKLGTKLVFACKIFHVPLYSLRSMISTSSIFSSNGKSILSHHRLLMGYKQLPPS